MSAITFDDTHWPLLLIHFTGAPSLAQTETYLGRRLDYLRRPEPHLIIYDTHRIRFISSEVRQRHMEWSRATEALRREKLLGNALIVTSPLVRLAMSLAVNVVRAEVPYFVAPALPEAALWSAGRLEERGYPAAAERIRQHFAPLAAPRSH